MTIKRNSGITESILKICDYIFITRPTVLFTYWTMILCGAGQSGNMNQLTFGIIVWISLAMEMTNLLNMLNDLETDLINQKLPWIYENLISISAIWKYIIFLTIISYTGLAIQGSKTLFWVSFISIGGVLGALYNLGPIPLKGRPVLSLTMMAVIGIGLWLTGSVATTSISGIPWEAVFRYCAAWTAVCLISMIPDIPGDRDSGKITFAVRYGAKRTNQIAAVLVSLCLIDSLLRQDFVILIPAIVSLPFFILASIKYSFKWVHLAGKSSVLVLSLTVGFFYSPIYLLLIAIYFPLAKFYHKYRLGMDYPTIVRE
ncbi:UbiA family prenyltransferase [bacterium]|nr:UbiA family prenyltransferase [bacterium]